MRKDFGPPAALFTTWLSNFSCEEIRKQLCNASCLIVWALLQAIWIKEIYCPVQETSLRCINAAAFFLILLEVSDRERYAADGSATTLRQALSFKLCSISTKKYKMCQKMSPHIRRLHHDQRSESFMQDGCFHVVYPEFYHLTFGFKPPWHKQPRHNQRHNICMPKRI